MSVFLGRHGLQAFLLDADARNYSTTQLAAECLWQFCVTNGKYNGFEVGICTAVLFLNGQMSRPNTLQTRQQSYQDLRTILDQGGPYQAIEAWIHSYYH